MIEIQMSQTALAFWFQSFLLADFEFVSDFEFRHPGCFHFDLLAVTPDCIILATTVNTRPAFPRLIPCGMLCLAWFCAGCVSIHSVDPRLYPPMPNGRSDAVARTNAIALDGAWHGLRVEPNPERKVTLLNRVNPVWWFGNADDPVPPADYRPNGHLRSFRWHLRNPFHNFDFYIIGVADKETVRSGRYPESWSNPQGGGTMQVTAWKHLRLPFIAYQRGRFNFYLGWRSRGNFGFKLNFERKSAPVSDPKAGSPIQEHLNGSNPQSEGRKKSEI